MKSKFKRFLKAHDETIVSGVHTIAVMGATWLVCRKMNEVVRVQEGVDTLEGDLLLRVVQRNGRETYFFDNQPK